MHEDKQPLCGMARDVNATIEADAWDDDVDLEDIDDDWIKKAVEEDSPNARIRVHRSIHT